MTRLFHMFLVMFMAFMASACSTGMLGGDYLDAYKSEMPSSDFGGMMSPRPFMLRNLPAGDDGYSVGFRNGCEVTAGLGAGLNRMHDMAYDVDRGLKDREYYAGYRAGHVYCLFYTDVDPL